MSDETTTASDQESQATDAPQQDAPAADLPDWVQDPEKAYAEIQKLRTENASWRNDLRELQNWKDQQQQSAQEAKDAEMRDQQQFKQLLEQREEELATLKAEIAQQEAQRVRAGIIAELGLPEGFADRLRGDTEEDLRRDAEALRGLIAPQAPQQSAPPAQQTAPQRPTWTPQSTTPVPTGQAQSGLTKQTLHELVYGKRLGGNS